MSNLCLSSSPGQGPKTGRSNPDSEGAMRTPRVCPSRFLRSPYLIVSSHNGDSHIPYLFLEDPMPHFVTDPVLPPPCLDKSSSFSVQQ